MWDSFEKQFQKAKRLYQSPCPNINMFSAPVIGYLIMSVSGSRHDNHGITEPLSCQDSPSVYWPLQHQETTLVPAEPHPYAFADMTSRTGHHWNTNGI